MSNASSKAPFVASTTGPDPEVDHVATPKRLTAKSKAPWTASLVVIAVVLSFFLAQIISSFIVGLYPVMHNWSPQQTDDWLTNSVFAQFFYVLITELLTLLVLWFFWRRYKTGVRAALALARRPQISDAAYATLGVIIYFGVYAILLGIINSVISVNTSQQQDVGFQQARGTVSLILTFISLVILPPIVEEITFRGFLFSGLRRKFGPVGAALGTSILFAAPHLLTGKGTSLLWIAAIDTFSLSLVLCYLREKTGALYSGMLVHAIKNAIAFVALFLIAS